MTSDRITQNPAVQGGKPCVRDTGITVGQILGAFATGQNRFDILRTSRNLEPADIDAVLAFARQQTHDGEVPDVETPQGPLSPAELVAFKFPQEANDRFESLVRRSKITRLRSEEETEVQDCLRLDHIFLLIKVKARHLVAAR